MPIDYRRSDDGPIRRVRLGVRSVGNNAVKQIKFPQEVPILRTGEMSIVTLIVEYHLITTKDGVMTVKLELKFDKGSFPLEIRPPLGELIIPFRMNEFVFDAACQRFHSVHHKSTSTLTTKPLYVDHLKLVPITVLSIANMVSLLSISLKHFTAMSEISPVISFS
jgi:hypothetical protein